MSFSMGCAVWSYKEWVGNFFPLGSKASDFLQLYAQRMHNVEGNTTFYATPSAETVQKWRHDTPASFKFCLKIPQHISHHGELTHNIAATHRFVQHMAALDERLGPFFLQLPPHFALRHLPQLQRWLDAWPTAHRVSVEVRHADWYTSHGEAQLVALLNNYNAGHCLMDVRPLDLGDLPGAEADLARARDHKPQVPMRAFVTGNLALVRYISHPDTPRNQALWNEWHQTIVRWLADDIDVYFFMHCPVETVSPQNARIFYRQLQQIVPLPALPWDELDIPEQASLF